METKNKLQITSTKMQTITKSQIINKIFKDYLKNWNLNIVWILVI